MFKKIIQLVYVSILLLTLLPQSLFAAELIFKVSPNNDFVEVRVDPQSKQMNVVEGKIEFSGEASFGLLVQIENGKSILPVWPTPPIYNETDKSIAFVGGVPNGFDSEGLLFKLRLFPVVFGDLALTYTDGNGYLNDGKGTIEPIYSKPFQINIDDGKINKTNEFFFSIIEYKYVIITLLTAIVLFVIFKYVIKKKYKQ